MRTAPVKSQTQSREAVGGEPRSLNVKFGRMGWESYAIQKVTIAYDKLIGSPDSYPGLDALSEARSDLAAVYPEDVPDDLKNDLLLARDRNASEEVVKNALARLHAACTEE